MKEQISKKQKYRILSALNHTSRYSPIHRIDLLNLMHEKGFDVNEINATLRDMSSPDFKLIFDDNENVYILPGGHIWLENYADDKHHRRSEFIRWIITTVIAVFALILSAVQWLIR